MSGNLLLSALRWENATIVWELTGLLLQGLQAHFKS